VQRFYLSPSYSSAKPGEAEALDLLMRVAASGSVSKLYKRLVIEEKKAASAGGWYSDSGLDSGRLGFYAIAAEKVSAEELEKAIDGVIADLRENGVTEAELDRARASLYCRVCLYLGQPIAHGSPLWLEARHRDDNRGRRGLA
jgi:zinc protease